jgi:hypothetical protein
MPVTWLVISNFASKHRLLAFGTLVTALRAYQKIMMWLCVPDLTVRATSCRPSGPEMRLPQFNRLFDYLSSTQ